MKKPKPKLSASQKRRSKVKQKKESIKHSSEQRNWVEDSLDWIPVDQFHNEDTESEESNHDGSHGSGANTVKTSSSSEQQQHHHPHQQQQQQQQQQTIESEDHTKDDVDNFTIKIICWNVLADSYCNRLSHPNLPPKYQVVFDRKKRPLLVQQTLEFLTHKLQPDFWALQEVDPPLGIAKLMNDKLGYGVLNTDSCKGGRVGRVDTCGLYYNKQKWKCIEHETLYLDDLAILQSGRVDLPLESISKIFKRSASLSDNATKTTNNNLQGLQCSFVRKNVALLARLEHLNSTKRVVVAVTHLFWNPAYEYVKLCQIHFVAGRVKEFCHDNEPIILCGDFNSQPNSSVHRYLTQGSVNAKHVAPWYALSRGGSRVSSTSDSDEDKEKENPNTIEDIPSSLSNDLATTLQQIHLSPDVDPPTSVKYILDFTLNKLCRWMRILGLDAALETEEEEQERTKNGNMVIFQRCLKEGRALVTTSSKLLRRKDCPPGTYFLDHKSLLNLEHTLVHLLLSHGVKLHPNEMLTRCVVCNGAIEEVFDGQQKKQIFLNHQAPEDFHEDVLEVYQCDTCQQGYWWCEKPTSSASRVKSQATKLLEICIKGGVPIGDDLGIFDFVDVENIRKEEMAGTEDFSLLSDRLDVVKWLQDENLTNPLRNLSSAYATPGTTNESLQFTNVTSGFVGNLDYIMYETEVLDVTDLLFVPQSYDELNDIDLPNGHLLPSGHWPSDHLAIGCVLALKNRTEEAETETHPEALSADLFCSVIPNEESTGAKHGQRCTCGCIPAVPSLFEMAELRKQARLKQAQK
jgi:mRNA deadenylase 3'-5' endonuclease subunit Ccr4/uncharacterized protein with PIN domain